jgi:hypothetical protein
VAVQIGFVINLQTPGHSQTPARNPLQRLAGRTRSGGREMKYFYWKPTDCSTRRTAQEQSSTFLDFL